MTGIRNWKELISGDDFTFLRPIWWEGRFQRISKFSNQVDNKSDKCKIEFHWQNVEQSDRYRGVYYTILSTRVFENFHNM